MLLKFEKAIFLKIKKIDDRNAFNSILSYIMDEAIMDQTISIVRLRTFMAAERKARGGRNPRTGETISIPALKVAKFVAGKGFREAMK